MRFRSNSPPLRPSRVRDSILCQCVNLEYREYEKASRYAFPGDLMPRSRLQQNVEKMDKAISPYLSFRCRFFLLSFFLYSCHVVHVLIMIRRALQTQLANTVRTPIITKRYAHAPVALNWEDPLDSASLFTEEELAIQETANSYCQERMLPRVLGMQ